MYIKNFWHIIYKQNVRYFYEKSDRLIEKYKTYEKDTLLPIEEKKNERRQRVKRSTIMD